MIRKNLLKVILIVPLFFVLSPSPAASQTPARRATAPDCAKGVIRLPNQAGTIQICSSFAPQVPQLAVQLNEVRKRLGAQQQEIAELNRLIRGLNSVSGGISPELQEKFLQNFSAELERSQSQSDAIMIEQFRTLSERIEELQSQMVSQISSPEKSAALADGLKGELGVSISNLEFGSAIRQLNQIERRLSIIETSVTQVKDDTTAIRSSVNSLDENGKKLARQGERSLELLQNVAGDFAAISNLGGLVAKPVSIAEKYNNARVLAQRGEVDRALLLYRELMIGSLQFADVAADFTSLLERVYGRKGAISYIEKDIKPRVSFAYYLYTRELLADDDVGDEKLGVINQALKADPEFVKRFPPLAHKYLTKILFIGPQSNGLEDFHPGLKTTSWLAILDMSKNLTDSVGSGAYRSYFIDQLRSSTDVEGTSSISKTLLSTPDELIKECREPFEDWDFLGHACSAVGVERQQSGSLPFSIVEFENTDSKNLVILSVNFDMLKSRMFSAKGEFSLDLYQIESGEPKARYNLESVQPLVPGFDAIESRKIIQNSSGKVIYPLGIPIEAREFLLCVGTMHPIYNKPYKIAFMFKASSSRNFNLEGSENKPANQSICVSDGKIPSMPLEPIGSIGSLDWKVYSNLSKLSDEKIESLDEKSYEDICEQIKPDYFKCSFSISKTSIRILIDRAIQRSKARKPIAALAT